jgi:hypothetical protein
MTQGSRPGLSYFAATRLKCCSVCRPEPASPAALWLRPQGRAALPLGIDPTIRNPCSPTKSRRGTQKARTSALPTRD